MVQKEKALLKRFLYLAAAALVASLLLAPAAMAQGQGQMMDQNMMMGQGQMQPLPGTGGLSVVGLSTLALLVSSGLVGAYAIRRRRNIA